MVDPTTAALMLSTTTAVPSIMGAFTAKPADIVTGSADPARLAELRRGETIGAGISLALAGMVASLAPGRGRAVIMVVAVTMVAVFVAEQERALRRSPHVHQGDLAPTPSWG